MPTRLENFISGTNKARMRLDSFLAGAQEPAFDALKKTAQSVIPMAGDVTNYQTLPLAKAADVSSSFVAGLPASQAITNAANLVTNPRAEIARRSKEYAALTSEQKEEQLSYSAMGMIGGPGWKPYDYLSRKGIKVVDSQKIKVNRDAQVKDIQNDVQPISKGEEIELSKLSNNQYLVQRDKNQFIIDKNKAESLENQGLRLGKQEGFLDEFNSLEETVRGRNSELKKLDEEIFALQDAGRNINDRSSREYKDIVKKVNEKADKSKIIRETYGERYSNYTIPGGENYREILIKAPITSKHQFESSHWSEPNVISHLRMNDRATPNGDKVAFIEEIQSDWAREGREKGFAKNIDEIKKEAQAMGWVVEETERDRSKNINIPGNKVYQAKLPYTYQATTAGDTIEDAWSNFSKEAHMHGIEKGVPSNPSLKNWQELTLKRALKEAVDNDAKYLSWINGEQTANRYDLSKQIDDIRYTKNNDSTYNISATKGDKELISEENLTDKELQKLVGKDIADKIISNKGKKQTNDDGDEFITLTGLDLKVGGEWASNLYDKQIPNILEKMTKKYGGKVETLKIGNMTQQAIKITPEIRALVKGEEIIPSTSKKTPAYDYGIKDRSFKPPVIGKMFNKDTLESEALKYKTADDFVGSKSILYHGTNAEFENFDKSKIGSQSDEGIFGRGFYFAKNKDMAGNAPYGGKAKIIKEVYVDLKNPLNISDFKTKKDLADYLDMSEDAFVADSMGTFRPLISQIRQFTSHVEEKGHDGVYVNRGGKGDEIVAFDPSQIKTKSQLIDIWNKAHENQQKQRYLTQRAETEK